MLCTNLKTVKQKSSVEFKCTSDLVFDTMVKFCIIIIFIVVVVAIAQLWITLRGNRCLPIVLVISILSLIPLVVKKSNCKNIVPVTHWGLPQGDFLCFQSPRLIQELSHWNITSDMTAFFPPPIGSFCRWELLGVWRREADPRARVHPDIGPFSVWNPGGSSLGPGPLL